MRKVVSVALSCAMVLSLAACSSGGAITAGNTAESSAPVADSTQAAAPAGNGDILSFGTGSVGGTDNVVLEALSSVVNSNTDLRTSTVTTSGGAEIISLIDSGDLQAGYSGTIDLVNAKNGAEPFSVAIPEEDMLQGFGFVTWALPIVVLDKSDIKTYEDLEGKHIGFPPAASSSTMVLNLVLDAYGIKDKVKVDYFTWSEGYTALKDGRIDAFVGSYANGSPISGIVETEATNPIRILNMSSEVEKKVKGMNSGIGSAILTSQECATIPAGETYLAAANSGVVIFKADVSEDDVYKYTKCAIDHVEDLKKISAYFDKFNDVAMKACTEDIPFHPGAAKALKEANMWSDNFRVYGE